MEAGGGVSGVEDEKNCEVVAIAAAEEVSRGEGGGGESTMSAGALRSTVVDASVVGAAITGSAVIGLVVEVPVDLAAIDSATVGGEGDAGASTIAGVAVGAAVIGAAGLAQGSSVMAQGSSAVADWAVTDLDVNQASGEVSVVKPDMQKEEVREGSRKRKLAEVAPDQEVVEPMEPLYQEAEESDGSLEYDSQDSTESVDSRNLESFRRNLLEKLEDGKLPFKKRGHFFCPWHTAKPKGGMLLNLKQHARELSTTGTSKQIRAEHAALLQVLDAEGDA